MIIETNIGNFGSFKDLLACMVQEHHNNVEITKCEYWFAQLPTGHYTLNDIRKVVTLR